MIKLNVKGRNVERFILRLNKNKINIYKMSKEEDKSINILIADADYENVIKLKSIYEINEVNSYGIMKVKKEIRYNLVLICMTIFFITLLIFFSNIIIDVSIIHNSGDVTSLLNSELTKYGIKKWSIRKNFNEIQEIKAKIINDYKDSLEWIEIENVGMKYVVRVEERIIKKDVTDNKKHHVIAKKEALIKDVKAYSGQIIKNTNQYVKKGDIIISGNITLNDKIKDIVNAKGEVYGETWYTTKTTFPLTYYEEKYTNNVSQLFGLKALNKEMLIGDNYDSYKEEEHVILYNLLLPIRLVRVLRQEIIIIDKIYTIDEAIKEALKESRKKINDKLGKDEYIIYEKQLKVNIKDSKIIVDVFYSVYENITDYVEVE